MFTENYILRPTELESVSCLDFVKDYKIKYDGKSKRKKKDKVSFKR